MRWGAFIEKLLSCKIGRRQAAGLFKREIILQNINTWYTAFFYTKYLSHSIILYYISQILSSQF